MAGLSRIGISENCLPTNKELHSPKLIYRSKDIPFDLKKLN